MFKIISVGWTCAPFIVQTLRSVEEQSHEDWEIFIGYDQSQDLGAEIIARWCADRPRDSRWRYLCNPDQRFAVQNQVEGIQSLSPDDEDIIVFLDLDGDQLANSNVLQRLADYYADNTLVTYGNYRPEPDPGTTTPPRPVPQDVVDNNSYRQYILQSGCFFNHLRTMKGKVFKAIPESYFKWPDGTWYTAGTDYTFMLAAMELAGGRYKCIEETLLIYNHANPLADNLVHPGTTNECVLDTLSRPPLQRLP